MLVVLDTAFGAAAKGGRPYEHADTSGYSEQPRATLRSCHYSLSSSTGQKIERSEIWWYVFTYSYYYDRCWFTS